MKQLQLNGKTLGVVDVPEGATNLIIVKDQLRYKTDPLKYWWDLIKLPPGEWEILGRLNDITEEQAAVFGKGDVTGFDAELFKINILSHGIEGNPLIILKLNYMTPDDTNDDYMDEDIEFIPCEKCDGHPACEDFGCAYELGLGRMVRKNIPPGSDDWS